MRCTNKQIEKIISYIKLDRNERLYKFGRWSLDAVFASLVALSAFSYKDTESIAFTLGAIGASSIITILGQKMIKKIRREADEQAINEAQAIQEFEKMLEANEKNSEISEILRANRKAIIEQLIQAIAEDNKTKFYDLYHVYHGEK